MKNNYFTQYVINIYVCTCAREPEGNYPFSRHFLAVIQ